MEGRASGIGLALLVSGTLAMAACGDKEPCPGVVDGASYKIEVGAQAPVDLASDCYQDWGIQDGSTFTARVTKLTGDGSCLAGVLDVPTLQGWDVTPIKQDADVHGEGFEGFYQGKFGACSALMSLDLSSEGDSMRCFNAGSRTSDQCLLTFQFQPQGAGCPAPCTAFLTTTVTRQ